MLPQSPLAEVSWLAENPGRAVILDASVSRIDRGTGVTEFAPGPAGFAAAHIPGARFADLMQEFSDPAAPFGFTAPSAQRLQDAARAIGINNDSTVVIYDSLGGAYAARLWLLLHSHGLERVYVLNGGLQAWQAAGLAVETGMGEPVTPGDFTARALRNPFVGAADILALVQTGAQADVPLLCALRPEQFRGDGSSDPRRGHIPTSLNLPYPALLGPDGRLDPARLPALLGELGLSRDIRPVLYCGGGINAAGLALAFHLIGITDVKIYDDSMAGWRADPALPVEAGA